MRQELAALVIHDLKNELVLLESQLGALQREPDRALAAIAHRHCTDMRRRFVVFLTLYGANGELRAHCGDESPRAFLSSLLTLVARPDEGAALRIDACEQAPPFWFFDFRLVRMALESALHNAWRFARECIVLSARQEGAYLVFTIDDDGPGLDQTDEAGGAVTTGLGTELCKAVARAHGHGERAGRVSLVNRAEGGARFELWLA